MSQEYNLEYSIFIYIIFAFNFFWDFVYALCSVYIMIFSMYFYVSRGISFNLHMRTVYIEDIVRYVFVYKSYILRMKWLLR